MNIPAFEIEGETPFSCRLLNSDGSHTTTEVTLRIDFTPPTITAATPKRPPDHGGWWNYPVDVAFSGADATSGIAACDTVPFAGPGAQVVGGCHDNAGNYGTRGFPVAYDSAPPTMGKVKAAAASRSATLTWSASADTVASQVTRSPGRRGARSSIVYSGVAHKFRDSSLANGTRYRYTVTVLDQAGNPASKTVVVRPRISLGLRPARATRIARAPLLRWPAIAGSSYYNVQLYRGAVKVRSAWPSRAHLKLRSHWTFLGRRMQLTPGRYRWYVWPGYGSRAAHHFGAFIGQSSFVIVRRAR
jgi:hypothetical protein